MAGSDPLLAVESLMVRFPAPRDPAHRGRRHVVAVNNVSFTIAAGSTLALVGESGSGKSTTARAIMRVQPIAYGSIRLAGKDITALRGRALREARRQFQMIFQDPHASLDPRQSVGRTIEESLLAMPAVARADRTRRMLELLDLVGLPRQYAGRFPHELSGGQRQRVGIARAVAVRPALLVCDEPVSALDVSVQAQIVNLFRRLQTELGLTYLFIAHDLAVVRHVADHVAVMYLGGIVEIGPADQIYSAPGHPYTAALMSAAPIPDSTVERARERIILAGEMPQPDRPPSGCRFHPRCPLRRQLGDPEICASQEPVLRRQAPPSDVMIACHFAGQFQPNLIGPRPPGVSPVPSSPARRTASPDTEQSGSQLDTPG